VLFGKRYANDGDGQDNPVHQVGDRNFPAKEYDPDHVENDIADTVGVFKFLYFSAKGGKCCHPEFYSLYAKRDAHDGEAEGFVLE